MSSPCFGQALERELAPVEEKLARLNVMAKQVIEAHPQDSSNVQSQLTDISAMWQRLKQKAANRKHQLEEAYMLQSFMSDSRDLVRMYSNFSHCQNMHVYMLFCVCMRTCVHLCACLCLCMVHVYTSCT